MKKFAVEEVPEDLSYSPFFPHSREPFFKASAKTFRRHFT